MDGVGLVQCRRDPGELAYPVHHTGHMEKLGVCNLKEGLTRTQPGWPPTSDFQPPDL